jgi:hypothetical protein
MTRQDVDMAIDWAAQEGWNPGPFDGDCFYSADPEGFLMGLIGNEPVATISAVKYGDSFAFMGFYIVKPEYRGMGYGIRIWNAGLDCLKGRTIGLDGVVEQQGNYTKSGFVLTYKNLRCQGSGGGPIPPDSAIVPLSDIPFEDLNSYDKPFFPDDREQFLKCWISQANSVSFGIRKNGKLAGYGLIRSCRSGYKIGPLFADSPEFADRLFRALKSEVPTGSPIFLDIPAINPAAHDPVLRHDMTVCFETARMYAGKSPDLPVNRLYGVTSFELG